MSPIEMDVTILKGASLRKQYYSNTSRLKGILNPINLLYRCDNFADIMFCISNFSFN